MINNPKVGLFMLNHGNQHQCPATDPNAGPAKTATFGAWSGGGDTPIHGHAKIKRDMVMWQTLPNPTINLPFKDGLYLYIPFI